MGYRKQTTNTTETSRVGRTRATALATRVASLRERLAALPPTTKSALVLAAVSLLFFYPLLLHPTQMVWGSDLVRAHSAYKWVQWRAWHVWAAFPLWDPTIFGGKSIVGDPLPALLNPLNAVFWLTPSPRVFGGLYWTVVLLASLGAYLWARGRRCDARGALLVACAFAFSGKTAGHLFAGHLELLSTVLMLPWLLWAADRTVAYRRFSDVGLLAVLFTATATFGSVQAVYWHVLFVLAYAVLVAADPKAPRDWRETLKGFGLVACGLLVFAGLAAAWWFPIVRQTLLLSARADTSDYAFATMNSVGWADLARFVWPFYRTPYPEAFRTDAEMGFFWETIAYPGLVTVTLALAAPWALRKDREIWVLSAMALVLVLLAMGPNTVVHRAVYELVPGFSLFRAPGRLLFYVNLIVALLAGRVLSEGRRCTSKAAVVVVPVALLQAVLALTLAWGRSPSAPRHGLWLPLFVLTGLSVAAFMGYYGEWSTRRWQNLCLALLLVDLAVVWHPHLRLVDPHRAFPEKPTARLLADAQGSGPSRFYDPTEFIQQQDAARYGLETIAGYHPGLYRHQLDLYRAAWRSDRSSIVELQRHAIDEVAYPGILDLLNVGFVVSTERVTNPDYEEIARSQPDEAEPFRYVYRRTTALPRAWVVPNAKTPPPGLTMLDALETLDPRTACLVDNQPVDGTSPFDVPTLTRHAPGDLTLAFTAEGSGVLVISESWHPDWRATDAGRPVAVRRVNHGLLGIAFGPGQHAVRVRYVPWDFYAGLLVSAVTATVLAGVLVWRRGPRPTVA